MSIPDGTLIWHITYAPFTLPQMTEKGGTVTFAPLEAIDAKTIQLRSKDKPLIFPLGAKTVYCQGLKKVTGWNYLKKMVGTDAPVTVMTNEGVDYALVIWDRGIRTSPNPSGGPFPQLFFSANVQVATVN
jgi:hypothetical protein